MTRFNIYEEEYDRKSLSKKEVNRIFEIIYLDSKKIVYPILEKEIKKMNVNKLKYHIFNPNENFVVTIKKEKKDVIVFSIGYPFPIISEKKNNDLYPKYEINIYFRGTILRDIQQYYFLENLRKNNLVNIKHYYNETLFKQEFKKCAEIYKKSKMAFYDMYRFIGDSILNTYVLDSFVLFFDSLNVKVFSRNNEHLKSFYNTCNNKDISKIYDYDIIILTDYIDISNGEAQNIILNSKGIHLYLWLSRNIFIIQNQYKFDVYILHSDYCLFNNQNIYKYMKRIVSSYIDASYFKQFSKRKYLYKPTFSIFLNPFSSLYKKSLCLDEIIKIICYLKEKGYHVYLPSGHNEYTKNIISKVNNKCECRIIELSNLSDLDYFFKQNNIIVISVDSAISHLALKSKKMCITLYRNNFWDKTSIQSICNESPIGFSSYSFNHIPLIINNNIFDNVRQINNILSFLNYDEYNTSGCVSLLNIIDDSLKEVVFNEEIDINLLLLENKLPNIRREKYDI